MEPAELMTVLEGYCPNCAGQELDKFEVTAHPDNQDWDTQFVTLVHNEKFTPRFGTTGRDGCHLMTTVHAHCPQCDSTYYAEQSAISGDWS